jgi:hypothetical protein
MVSRAAKVLEQLPIQQPTVHVLANLVALHPPEVPHRPPVATEPAVDITEDTQREVLRTVQRGSAGRPSGWTFEHVKAATSASEDAFAAVLRLVRTINLTYLEIARADHQPEELSG